jgi:putative tricarboxylic transport membrane protein
MNKKDFYTGLIFLLFTGVIFVLILQSPPLAVPTKPGPFFFPTVAALLLGGLSLALLINGVRQKETGAKGKGKTMMGRVIWIIAWCAIYAFTIERLGYLLSTAVVTFALLWYFNRRQWIFNIVMSVGIPVSIFILFDTLLKQSLPRGIFGS